MRFTRASAVLPVGVVVHVNGLSGTEDLFSEFSRLFGPLFSGTSKSGQTLRVEANTAIGIVLEMPSSAEKETARALRALAKELDPEG